MFRESLVDNDAIGDSLAVAASLAALAGLALARGDVARSATLLAHQRAYASQFTPR